MVGEVGTMSQQQQPFITRVLGSNVIEVVVTGAAGRAGTALIDHLDRYALTALDHEPKGDGTVTIVDVTNFNALVKAFEDHDAVVHLAANPDTNARWDSVLENNVIGTYNVMEAACSAAVETVVFASSNHVVGMYEQEHAPDLYDPGYDLVLDHEVPTRPDSLYGTSKVFGEAIGRQYVGTREWPRRFYALRIGSLRSPEYDHPYGDAERGVAKDDWERDSDEYDHAVNRMMGTWHSRRDFAHLVDRCLVDSTVDFDIFYGVSDNICRWFDIEHARAVLGYQPTDQSEQYNGPPERVL